MMASRIPTFTVDQRAFSLLGENLYEGRLAAIWGREVVQNAVDAGARNITLTFRQGYFPEGRANFDFDGTCARDWEAREAATILTCEDDGIGMDDDVIHDAFLRLGGSFKLDETENIGGYGAAKAIILCGQMWSLDTNEWHLDSGMMGNESIRRVDSPRDGTLIEMGITTSSYYRWKYEDLRTCLVLCHLPGVRIRLIHLSATGAVLSDEVIKGVRAGRELIGLGWAKLSSNGAKAKVYRGLHVRARGLYQFTSYLSYDACVFLDIDHLPRAGEADYPLTVSREGLKSQYRVEVEAVSQTLIVEPRRATEPDGEEETLTRYELGRPVMWDVEEPEAIDLTLLLSKLSAADERVDVLPPVPEWRPSIALGQDAEGPRISPLDFPFVVLRHRKHSRNMAEMTKKGQRLLAIWHELVVEVSRVLGSLYVVDDDMLVGLVLKDDVRARFMSPSGDDPKAILMNPRGLRASDPAKVLLPMMLGRLVEELAHADGLDRHDEALHSGTNATFEKLVHDHYTSLEAAVLRGQRVPINATTVVG